MTHQPPVPAASTSPFPLHPEPVDHSLDHLRPATKTETPSASGPAISNKAIGIGAAIGIGSAAIVAALLYARRDGAESRADHAGRTAKNSSGKGGDDKTKRGKGDRARVAGGQAYEVAYFARKHGLTAAEARTIIAKAGPDRDAADALAKRHARG